MDPGAHSATTVLIVEDDVDLLSAISEALRDEGYLVLTASDGAAALALMRGVEVSLIVSDLAMPGMDGLSLVEASSSSPGTSMVPIVMMTGSERIHTPPPGCVAVLTKPFSLQALLVIVREHTQLT